MPVLFALLVLVPYVMSHYHIQMYSALKDYKTGKKCKDTEFKVAGLKAKYDKNVEYLKTTIKAKIGDGRFHVLLAKIYKLAS
jgi:hypothetical protein